MNPPAAPAIASKDPIESLTDFSDRISPIVVKELRQGLRQASFVILFLFLQSVLALAVIASLFSISDGSLSSRMNIGMTVSAFFFSLFALAVMVVQPLRALGALSGEIRDNTMDLLLLTRLDAWRIVFGKWLCLVTQSALLLLAVLPYLMMRYFIGGMNLVAELTSLFYLFLLGSMICAAGVGVSVIRSIILRVIIAIVGGVGFLIALQMVSLMYVFRHMGGTGFFSGFSLQPYEWVLLIIGSLLMIGFLTYSFLEFGATRIAPPSENRSTRKRTITLLCMVFIPSLYAIIDFQEVNVIFVILALMAPFAMADSLTENPRYIYPSNRPFDLPFLRPGWPSGTLFSLLLMIISGCWVLFRTLTHNDPHSSEGETILGMGQALFTIFLMIAQPALIVALLRPRDHDPANTYLTMLFGSIALGMVLLMVGAAINESEQVSRLFFPIFPVLGFGTLDDPKLGLMLMIFVTAIIYLVGAAVIGFRKCPATHAE